MNLFVKLMMLGLVLAVAGPLFITGPDGKPLMDIKFFAPDTGNLSSSPDAFTDALGADKTKVYKWRDENGIWQISDQPPMDVLLAEEGARRQDQAFGSAGAEVTQANLMTSNLETTHRQPSETSLTGTNQSYNVQELTVNANANVVQSLPKSQINKALDRPNMEKTLTSSSTTEKVIRANSRKVSESSGTADSAPFSRSKLAEMLENASAPTLNLLSVSPSDAIQLFDDAHEVQRIMNERTEQLEAIGQID